MGLKKMSWILNTYWEIDNINNLKQEVTAIVVKVRKYILVSKTFLLYTRKKQSWLNV